MIIPKQIQEIINNQELYVLSTCCNNISNIIYVKFLKVYDDEHILIADNKFFKTAKNLEENPKMSFVVLDTENRKAYQVQGDVELFREGPVFDETVNWVHESRPDLNPQKGVLLKVNKIYCGADEVNS